MILGVDVGGTRLKAGLVREDGSVARQFATPTPVSPAAFEAALRELVQTTLAGDPVEAAGIGCKGIIEPATTRVESLPGTLNFLEGRRLGELLALGVPVEADNDARAALAGELLWGAARGRADALMLTLGTGVGGGVVSGGRLLRGFRGIAGHLGHINIDPRGPQCICGNRGCLETRFSAQAIEAEARAAVRRGCASRLTTRFLESIDELTCEEVFRAVGEGDELAGLIVSEAVGVLGAALSGLILALDPEIVILGGQIAAAGPALFNPLAREIDWRTRRMLRREVPLVRQQLGEGSGLVGAAALAVAARADR